MENRQGKETATPKIDRRIRRTQQLLHEALINLILEKGYEDITVQDIIDRADVGRSTFYAHFLDKDDLFIKGFEHLRSLLEEEQSRLTQLQISQKSDRAEAKKKLEFTLILFEHVQSQARLYKALVGKRSGELLRNQFHKIIGDLICEQLSAQALHSKIKEIPLEITVEFMASTLISLVTWWLDHEFPYSAAQMNTWFHQLVDCATT